MECNVQEGEMSNALREVFQISKQSYNNFLSSTEILARMFSHMNFGLCFDRA